MDTTSVSMMSDAMFSTMQNSETILGMCRNTGNTSMADIRNISEKEKNLQMQNLNNEITYLASECMADSEKKMMHDKIKRSFAIFA